ncbi:MAG: diguanylate cyclase [Firmicutes bacterium]|nr:diguanylate cyclase [Bacillota bacterium]
MLNNIFQGRIRTTLLFGMLVIIALSTSIGAMLYYNQLKDNLDDQTHVMLQAVVEKQAYFIENWFWQKMTLISTISSSQQLKTGDEELIKEYLKDIIYKNIDIQDMGVADLQGNVQVATSYHHGINIKDRQYFKQALEGKKGISHLIYNRFSYTPVIVFAAPVYKEHQVSGVFFASISIDNITKIMQNLNLGRHTESYIVDSQRRMVSNSLHEDKNTIGTMSRNNFRLKIDSTGVKNALMGISGVGKYINYRGVEVYGAYKPMNVTNMAVVIEQDVKAFMEPREKQALLSTISIAGFIILLFMPVLMLMSRRFAEPLEKLNAAAQDIRDGDLGVTVNIKGNKEVSQLASSFNEMSLQIKRINEQLNESINTLEEQKEEIESQNEELLASEEELQETNKQLDQIATTDYLTKVFNRRYLFEYISSQIQLACKRNMPFSLILFDIDYFKRINDQYGHHVGDQVLIGLTEVIFENSGQDALLARFGGEEFVLVVPSSKLEYAKNLAERLRLKIANHIFKTDGGDIKLTVSFGVTSFSGEYCNINGMDLDRLITQVDDLLYRAKKEGRNRVVAELPNYQ